MQKTAEVHANKSERDYFIFVKKYFIDNFCMLRTVELKAQSVILFTTQGINRILMLLLSEHNSVSECTPESLKHVIGLNKPIRSIDIPLLTLVLPIQLMLIPYSVGLLVTPQNTSI